MFRSSYKCSGAVISVPEQLVSVPEQLVSATEQLGYADFLYTMTPIRFHRSQLNSLKSRIFVSVDRVRIDYDNGSSPIQR